jgi:hypothetical protein
MSESSWQPSAVNSRGRPSTALTHVEIDYKCSLRALVTQLGEGQAGFDRINSTPGANMMGDRSESTSGHAKSGGGEAGATGVMPGRDLEPTAALLKILAMGQRDVQAGNFRDVDEFLNEIDVDDGLL